MLLSFAAEVAAAGGSVELAVGDRVMVLHGADDRATLKVDLGFPVVRDVVADLTDRSGTRDTTALHGARAITLDLVFFDERRHALLDELRSYCHPAQRPVLTLQHPEWDSPRRVVLRADSQSAPLSADGGWALEVSASWVAPSGLLEGVDEMAATIMASGGAGSVGIRYPVRYPVRYTPGGGGGVVTVSNPGSAPASPVARLYGPHTGPQITRDGGGTLAFPGLAIAAGDYLEVDFAARTARVNGLPDASRYGALDFAGATWWDLPPGESAVRFTPDAYSGAAQAVLTYRPAYL